ncbi:hypothetical protein Clacol_007421 [Clathrus columnatus]|uniref:Uncharacterized protein n=1 Tax=Clathrus columnatus TaxID=1419009 RepID=A0AAV5AFT9_9AGAM|nr:hypothetical protein Clacol_007421 [Clathrus columnatus]
MNNDAGEPPFERPEDNVKVYLSVAVLPEMILNESAPPIIPPGHKAHLNHLHVRPERYRRRLSNLISCRDLQAYDQLVKRFVQRLPTVPIDLPPTDQRTGAAFTIPVLGLDLNVPTIYLPRPSTIYDMVPWMYAYPFQTLTRAMQVSFPQTASWSLTPLPAGNMDIMIWHGFLCTQTGTTTPRIRVLIEFGARCPGFEAGHIYAIKSFDTRNPTIMETLVFHTARSMGLANDLYLPEYFDSTESYNNPPECPLNPPRYPEMEFPDSDSEWEGMDDANVRLFPSTAPDTSAGVSEYLDIQVSAYGSEAYVELPISRVFRSINSEIHNRRPQRQPSPPVAGPSQIRGQVTGTRRTRASSYIAGVTYPTDSETEVDDNLGAARAATRGVQLNDESIEDNSDVESDNVQIDPPPPPPTRVQYFGVSRATAETTNNIVTWSDNVETDVDGVEDLLQMDEVEDENPNAITHALDTESLYLAAMQTLNPDGGPSLSLPRPPQQIIHSRPLRNIGGYLTVVPELGAVREAEEVAELREEARRDAQRAAEWIELQRDGVAMPGDGADHNPDDNTWISETGLVLDRSPAAA